MEHLDFAVADSRQDLGCLRGLLRVVVVGLAYGLGRGDVSPGQHPRLPLHDDSGHLVIGHVSSCPATPVPPSGSPAWPWLGWFHLTSRFAAEPILGPKRSAVSAWAIPARYASPLNGDSFMVRNECSRHRPLFVFAHLAQGWFSGR